jgi:lipopolysaccharide transport system permease protein
MDRPLKETVYSPDSELLNPGRLFRNMMSDLLASRELAWRLFVRNISAQYRQSLLGYFWAFIPPLFTTLIWVFLNSQNILNVGDTGMPYPLFVLTGTVLWQTFADALDSPLKLVNESKAMLAKINFPREALILTSIGMVLFNFSIRVVLLVLVFVWYEVSVPATIFLVPLGVLSMVLFGLMVGLLLTPFGVLYNDIGRTIAIATQAWFFLTPVIYPVPPASWAATLVKLNPVTPLLQTTREWLITGQSTQLSAFLGVTVGTLVFLFIGWVIYRIAMPHLIARMSA